VLGDLTDLVHSLVPAGLRLVAQVVPRLDARQQDLESAALEPLDVRLGEDGQTALRDEIHSVGRHRRVDGVQGVVESNTEVRIVPADARPLQFPQEEPEVVREHPEV